MKTYHAPSLTAVIGLVIFSLTGCSGRAEDKVSPPTPPVVVTPPAAPAPPANKGEVAEEDASTTATATWAAIKDYPFARRADVIAGLTYMTKKLDAGMLVLSAKRAGMTDAAAKDWDFNLKELNDARAYLQSMGTGLEKAGDDTWNDAKDKIDQAWQRVRNAYAKVRQSTTS